MLYLEDYLEMIEHLPQELKDRFTELRELDLQVQNSSDKLDDRVRQFFNNAKRAKLPERDSEFENIRKEYNKVLEDADEKVHQATDMYNLVERYLKRLDQELHKFKLELEADNAGITEVIEKRFIELDQMSLERKEAQLMQSHKENRLHPPMTIKQEKKDRKPSTDKPGTSGGGRIGSGGLMGAGGNAIAAAVHQAIAATTLQQVGRRTPSLKASYDLFNMGLNKEFNYGNKDGLLANTELQQAAQQALAATTGATNAIAGSSDPKKNKRKQPVVPQEPSMSSADEIMGEPVLQTTLTPDWTYDPSEPVYCLCNQVSYGEMVACDNESCPIEWFHYGCVGIKSTPVGKWYCPECTNSMKRRKKRQ